jgi:hypothetical protein
MPFAQDREKLVMQNRWVRYEHAGKVDFGTVNPHAR